VTNRFQNLPFKFNLRRYIEEQMQQQMRQMAVAEAFAEVGLFTSWVQLGTHSLKPFYLSSETVLRIK
jgi:hypothetical protein